MTHSTHFIYDCMTDVWFRNTHNTRGNPMLPLYGLLFSISSKESFIYMHWERDVAPW